MKLSELFEVINKISVDRPWQYHIGRRGKDFEKMYFKPFVKHVDSEMKTVKSKWNGSGYDFTTPELADQGKKILNQLAIEWKQLLVDHPENESSLDASIADEYFKHLKKHKLG